MQKSPDLYRYVTLVSSLFAVTDEKLTDLTPHDISSKEEDGEIHLSTDSIFGGSPIVLALE